MSALSDARRLLDDGIGWAGLGGDALAFVLAEVAAAGRWLVVVDETDAALRLLRALSFFHRNPERIELFPADDARPYDGFSPHPEIPRQRLRALQRVDAGGDVLVVAPAPALLHRVPDRETRRKGTRLLQAGDRVERGALVSFLTDAGYLAAGRVVEPGSFAVRGDVVDVWPAASRAPVRIDLFDDEVEEIRRFEPETQRAGAKRERVLILPAREERLDDAAMERLGAELGRRVAEQARGAALRRRITEDLKAGIRFSALEAYLPALVPTVAPLDAMAGLRTIVVHPEDVAASLRELERNARARWEVLEDDERPLVVPSERYVAAALVAERLERHPAVREFAAEGVAEDLGARPVYGFHLKAADLSPAVSRLRDLAKKELRVGLVVEEGTRAQNLRDMLGAHGLVPRTLGSPWLVDPGEIALVLGDLPRGFVAEEAGWAFVPASTLFGERAHAANKAQVHRFFDVAVTSVAQLKDGDPIVHRVHGIGLYRGMLRVDVGGVEQDFARLEYRDGDLLYLPATQLDMISRYTGARAQPKIVLDRLGGSTWAKRRGRVRDAVLAMAHDLLRLYARREVAERPPYPQPGSLYRTFEARFPYEETPDQATAIEAVTEDLSRHFPMDRLVCGDVGFGKTEVAMRAAMRVVESGRQVAVLCPTTVLAFQHLRTFRERFQGFPVRVEMLSRFTEPAEERAILAGLKSGEVDVVVGTTRIMARDARFSDLGLLVVDEEHRFGVKQKERLKRLRAEVDVLAMSATPIPRTLEMALSGIRDMSLMTTPPEERLAVRTSVSRFTRTRVRDAILHEIERGGQVFFVHNRVQDIEVVAENLREWVPEATFAVAHGQMEDDDLERVLVDFIQRRHQVLVASTIIESGVDLPNVNTMIVNRADTFGLAQLYQLRGRVGRSSVRASCLLLTPEEMTKDARKRLRVLVEHQSLGAGFQIAAADLELRGGGNLVGEAQHGSIDAVGWETWLELLAEAVAEARGEHERQRIEPEVEVPVPAFIPERYLPDVQERLGWYRQIAGAASPDAVDALLDDLEDQFGELPPEARNLAGLVQTKLYCRDLGVVRLSWLKIRVVLEFHPTAEAPSAGALRDMPRRFVVLGRDPLRLEVRFTPKEGEKPFQLLRWALTTLGRDAG